MHFACSDATPAAMHDTMRQAKDDAVRIAGGSRRLSEKLLGRNGRRLTRQAVEDWRVVPAHHVLRVEELTGVSRHVLRPDIYGPHPGPLRLRVKAESRPAA